MMKKLSLFIFTFFISLICISGVSAQVFEYTCEYDDYHANFSIPGTTNYSLTYTYNDASKLLELTNCSETGIDKNPVSCNDLQMEPTSWNGSTCPNSFNIDDDTKKITISNSINSAEYIHYWEWVCYYDFIGTDKEDEDLTGISIYYRNLVPGYSSWVLGGYVFGEEGATFGYDIEYEAVSLNNEAKQCTNLQVAEINEKGTHKYIFKIDKSGPYKGSLANSQKISNLNGGKNFDYNRTSAVKIGSSMCPDYSDESKCIDDPDVACVWTENEAAPNGGFCNVDNLLYVGCGGASDIPMQVPKLIAFAVNALKIATPIILIFMGMITLIKAMSAGKEDEIKKATSSLTKKLIAAAMVFFVIAIVQFVVSKVASDDDDYNNFSGCLECFLNNDCERKTYYKTVIGKEDYCTSLTTGETEKCNPTEE